MFTLLEKDGVLKDSTNIPSDVLSEIFSYFLTLEDISAINLVCKNWYFVNHRDIVWQRRFKHHYPDLHAKYNVPSYRILITPINWYELYVNTHLQTCVDFPRNVIKNYHITRRCNPDEIENLLEHPEWKKHLFFYDMEGASIWDFLYRLGDHLRRQTILDLIFNKLSAHLRQEDNSWNFEQQLTYDVERQLHMNIPKDLSITSILRHHNELICYAIICNQTSIVTTWLQLQIIPLNINIIAQLCLFAIRMGHQEILEILFTELEKSQTASLFVNWDNSEFDTVLPCYFCESRQPFYDYVFSWLNRNPTRVLGQSNLKFVALQFNQIEFIRAINKESFDFNLVFLACSKEMVQVLREERKDLTSLPTNYSLLNTPYCFRDMEVLHAICKEASLEWGALLECAIELGSLQGFNYLLPKIPVLSYQMIQKILLNPNPALLLRFFKLYPDVLKQPGTKENIDGVVIPPCDVSEALKWRLSMNRLKWLPAFGMDMEWYLSKYCFVFFIAEMSSRFPRIEVIRFALQSFSIENHGDMIISELQRCFETLTQHFNTYPDDVESYSSLIEIIGELLAFGVDVEKNDRYDTCILGRIEHLKIVNAYIAKKLEARIPQKQESGCSIL